MDQHPRPRSPLLRALFNRDYFLLWSGGTISILGSQFSLIALPWLVLQLTNDPLALGTVLGLGGLPRAAFMLVGGAITDRLSPRAILLACDVANCVLAGLAAALIGMGAMQVWMVYVLSLLTGLLAGFIIPAANSIAPLIVPADDLQAANAISMGSAQMAGFVGPALAGIVIGSYAGSTQGVGLGFTVDAVSFAVSALGLWAMRGGRLRTAGTAAAQRENVLSAIGAGLRYVAGHDGLGFMFIIMAGVNFLFTGPLLVGIPVLADQRLAEGAQAFGFLMSAYAGGNLAGLLLAGALPRPSGRGLRVMLIALLASFGGALVSFGWITATWIDVALMLLLGLGNGYIGIVIFTWIQQRTPPELLGRIMSLMMLSSLGLVPLSQMLAGVISRWDLTALFSLAGGLVLALTLWAAQQPALRTLSQAMTTEPSP